MWPQCVYRAGLVRYVFTSGRVKAGSTLGPWNTKAVCLVVSKVMMTG